ncbi:MAG: hypothetical protein ACK56F_17785 [bacterium]
MTTKSDRKDDQANYLPVAQIILLTSSLMSSSLLPHAPPFW